jgi:hypothetical protein
VRQIKGFEISIVIQLKSRNPTVVRIAPRDTRTYTTQKQQITNCFGVGVIAYWFGTLFHDCWILCGGKDAAIFIIYEFLSCSFKVFWLS